MNGSVFVANRNHRSFAMENKTNIGKPSGAGLDEARWSDKNQKKQMSAPRRGTEPNSSPSAENPNTLNSAHRETDSVQEVQLGLGFFQGFKSGLQMWCLKIVEVRPAKHVVDDRFGGLDPFLRPAQDGQRKRPSGRIAVDAGARGGHG
jgi:hypothetical protein